MLFNLLYFYSGAIVGSFLNVVIYRIPNSLSIVKPRSFCQNCKTQIPFYFNIPIISYIYLNGKCNYCREKISLQYIIIEIITGMLLTYSFNNYIISEALMFFIIGSLLLCIAAIDYQYFIIPIELTIISIGVILPYICIYSNLMFHIYGMIVGLGYLVFILFRILSNSLLFLLNIDLICS